MIGSMTLSGARPPAASQTLIAMKSNRISTGPRRRYEIPRFPSTAHARNELTMNPTDSPKMASIATWSGGGTSNAYPSSIEERNT